MLSDPNGRPLPQNVPILGQKQIPVAQPIIVNMQMVLMADPETVQADLALLTQVIAGINARGQEAIKERTKHMQPEGN